MIKVETGKTWNDLLSELKDKVGNTSYRLMPKQLKEHFLQQTLKIKHSNSTKYITLISFLLVSVT